MKLIIKYYDENGDQIYPAIYSSAEVLHCDFVEVCEKAFKEKKPTFTVGDIEFDVYDFIYRDWERSGDYVRDWPEIMTIDEWFEKSEKDKELIIQKI